MKEERTADVRRGIQFACKAKLLSCKAKQSWF